MTAEEFLMARTKNGLVERKDAYQAVNMAREESFERGRKSTVDILKRCGVDADTDWKQVRIQAAITVMPFCAETAREILIAGKGLGEDAKDKTLPQIVAGNAVEYANTLVAELKQIRKGGFCD